MNELIWPITYLILIIGFAPIIWFEAIKPLIQKLKSKRDEQPSPAPTKEPQ